MEMTSLLARCDSAKSEQVRASLLYLPPCCTKGMLAYEGTHLQYTANPNTMCTNSPWSIENRILWIRVGDGAGGGGGSGALPNYL